MTEFAILYYSVKSRLNISRQDGFTLQNNNREACYIPYYLLLYYIMNGEKIMDRIDWIRFSCEGYFRLLLRKLGKKQNDMERYLDKKILTRDECADFICQRIEAGSPLMVGRFGGDEINVTAATDAYDRNISKRRIVKYHNKRLIYYSAGLFPENTELLLRFGRKMIEDSGEIDLLGVWNIFMEDYIVKKYVKDASLTNLNALEPWYNPHNPWTRSLKGKKVLVISPFADTIAKQYTRREKLFPGTEILPEFDLYCVKAVVSGGGQKDERFKDWFEALQFMYDEAIRTGFDIAILGCASYGFPLAAMFKKSGKQAIQLGGATQLLFGIKGARWDNHPIVSRYYNEAWVRPSQAEHFADTKIIENSCYW